jgi:tRNA threonylcarbamoyladenosine biosynthesis protein TsaB
MSVVLGFDTSTPVTTAAVLLPDGSAVEAHDEPPSESRGQHAGRLLGLLERVLGEAGVGWDEVGRLAVGTGPGGFTGLRIGVATARALAQARGLSVVGVSSLEALAAGAFAATPGPVAAAAAHAEAALSGSTPAAPRAGAADRPVAAVIDARRGEVFAAVFAPDGSPLLPPAALPPATFAQRLAALSARPLAVGDGAVRFAEELASAGAAVPPAGAPVHRLSAVQICRLGAGREPADRDALLPTYLREPDAKPSVMT